MHSAWFASSGSFLTDARRKSLMHRWRGFKTLLKPLFKMSKYSSKELSQSRWQVSLIHEIESLIVLLASLPIFLLRQCFVSRDMQSLLCILQGTTIYAKQVPCTKGSLCPKKDILISFSFLTFLIPSERKRGKKNSFFKDSDYVGKKLNTLLLLFLVLLLETVLKGRWCMTFVTRKFPRKHFFKY